MDGYDEIGQRVAVYWPREDAWFEGTITSYDRQEGFRVEYDDGDEEFIKSLETSHVRRVSENDATLAAPTELRATPDEDDWEGQGQTMQEESPLGVSRDDLGASLDNFSPLPIPRVDSMHRIAERRQADPEDTIHEDVPWRSQRYEGGDDRDRFYTMDAASEEGRERAQEEEEVEEEGEGRDRFDDQDEDHCGGPSNEEVALLQGEVVRATNLPCLSPCFARVLYVESSGANVLFACKTTVHQTEVSLSESIADPEWQHNSFRFELLAPIPGDPIKGELIFAVFETPADMGTTNFLGQAIIDLSSAADAGSRQHEKKVEGSYPLRTRKGGLLPSGQIYIRLHVRLPPPRLGIEAPLPMRQPSAWDRRRAEALKNQSSSANLLRPPTRGTTTTKKSGVASSSAAQGCGPRKWHGATQREKEVARIARANKIHREKLAKYKPPGGGGGGGSSRKAAADAADGGNGGENRLTIEIPGEQQEAGPKGSRRQTQAKYSTEQLGILQQEVAAQRDRIKVLGAKQVRLEGACRRNNKANKGAVDKSSADENKEPNQANDGAVARGVESSLMNEDPLLLGLASFSDDALALLEQRGSVQVGVYRDLLSRRRAWQSRIDTFKGEWIRSSERVKSLQEKLEDAERARRSAHHTKPTPGGGGGEEHKVAHLQARAQDLKVDIEALKTSKELKLANGDLEHELRVLQCSLDQSQDMAAEKRERLKTVQFDRDAYRDKHQAMSAGQLHEKLTTSVNALQLALLVLSKERGWNQLVAEGMQVQGEAAARMAEGKAVVVPTTTLRAEGK